MTGNRIALAIILVTACLIILHFAFYLLIDWLWFSAIGFSNVFWTMLETKLALFCAVFTVSAILLWLNGSLANRFTQQGERLPAVIPIRASMSAPTFASLSLTLPLRSRWRLLIAGASLALAAVVALSEAGNWDVVLRFFYQAPFGQTDPLFGLDIGFYLFALPALIALKNWMLLALALSILSAGAIYWAHGDLAFDKPEPARPWVVAHGSFLFGLLFLIQAWSYWLDRFLLLYDDNSVVVGAGYTDVHVELPALWALAGLASVLALVSCINIRVRSYKVLAGSVTVVVGSWLLLTLALPILFQRLYVKPNELQLETPYLERNISLTKQAYNLRQFTVKLFPAEQGLTFQSLQENRATIDNIRLWDYQPLLDTYAQLQEIRTYYRFYGVDIDRYELGGSYQQVMLSPRELAPYRLQSKAQTWVNLHLVFTHGDGVVMSPVTRKSPEGLPIFYLQDIPPVASGGPDIHEPRIYFGERADSYVIVNGTAPEFDFPKGKDNVYGSYKGAGGVAIDSALKRWLFAWYFNDLNILLSDYITSESRILFRRSVADRIQTIAPFLRLDHDPYIVVSEGRLFWIQDAYTTSDWFPYAERLPEAETNYIRNSVKIVLDAYNGAVGFYVVDPTDPVIATYQRIFPELFKPFEAMSEDLQKHIRYPEDLFLIQAQMFRSYHMDNPKVFYNREDLWQFPRQPTGLDGLNAGGGARMAPYYIIMRLPGEARAEFFLMLPMVPSQRENMIAWLAARCDPPNYGKMVVYEFPKDKLIYGPFQIEARINQNTEISQQISLWNQMGSRVIRGHLLVAPIENSILYVSPLYLRAETGQLPELKRVIAAYGDRVVMKETLAEVLSALFEGPSPLLPAPPVPTGPSSKIPPDPRAREALGHFDRATTQLKGGDWSGFGRELDAVRSLLEQLSGHPGPHTISHGSPVK
ncbi:MAG: UPF0182 family membrane protein [Methylocystis sp.]|uniref:UPF0182 family membrane protein n=1 Tax=Methylocystis sp. TaxID=1911079 RepID=UPI003DA6BB89